MPNPTEQTPGASQEEVVRLFRKAMIDQDWRDKFLNDPIKVAGAEVPPVKLEEWQQEKIRGVVKHAFFIMKPHVQCNPEDVIREQIAEDQAQTVCAACSVVWWKPKAGYSDEPW